MSKPYMDEEANSQVVGLAKGSNGKTRLITREEVAMYERKMAEEQAKFDEEEKKTIQFKTPIAEYSKQYENEQRKKKEMNPGMKKVKRKLTKWQECIKKEHKAFGIPKKGSEEYIRLRKIYEEKYMNST